MKEITLTQGEVALVDDIDFEYLNQWKWYFDGRYAQRRLGRSSVRLHCLVLERKLGHHNFKQVDHQDRNKLNCCRYNLRPATNQQNCTNKDVVSAASGYKGVYPERDRWKAQITVDRRTEYLGTYLTPIEAAKAYNDAALEYFGEFARLNPV
jgi:hypothetical protein